MVRFKHGEALGDTFVRVPVSLPENRVDLLPRHSFWVSAFLCERHEGEVRQDVRDRPDARIGYIQTSTIFRVFDPAYWTLSYFDQSPPRTESEWVLLQRACIYSEVLQGPEFRA